MQSAQKLQIAIRNATPKTTQVIVSTGFQKLARAMLYLRAWKPTT
jgi:hypothetical protein